MSVQNGAKLCQTMEGILGRHATFLSCLYLHFTFFTSFLLYSDLEDFWLSFLFICFYFGLFGFGRTTHANGEWGPKKEIGYKDSGGYIPVLVLLTLMDICVLFRVAFLSSCLLSIFHACSFVYGSKHSVCLYVLCLSFTIYDYDYDYEHLMITLVYFTFHVSYFQFWDEPASGFFVWLLVLLGFISCTKCSIDYVLEWRWTCHARDDSLCCR